MNEPKSWLVITGNGIINGLTFFGPFDDEQKAREWAGKWLQLNCDHITLQPINKPFEIT